MTRWREDKPTDRAGAASRPRQTSTTSSHLNVQRAKRGVGHLAVVLAVLSIWTLLVELGIAREVVISTPFRVAVEIWSLFGSASTWSAIRVTLQELFVGLGLGAFFGILLGTLFARIDVLDAMFKPIVMAIYTVPRLALIPLFVVWFGFGPSSKIAVAVIHGFVLFLLGAFSAISGANNAILRAVRVFGAGPMQRLVMVLIPSAVPYLMTSARQAIGLGLGSVIVAEMASSFAGMGFEISQNMAGFDMTGVLAWVVLSGGLALLIDRMAMLLERRSLRWR